MIEFVDICDVRKQLFGIDASIKMCIYKITNRITNKSYIGQTKNSARERWNRHSNNSDKRCSALKDAVTKYGVLNFKFEVIDICESIDQLNHKEQFYINLYNTLSPNGYNLYSGGLNYERSLQTNLKIGLIVKNRIFKESTRKKLSIASKKNGLHANFVLAAKQSRESRTGKPLSESTKNKIGFANSKIWSEERKDKFKSRKITPLTEEQIKARTIKIKAAWVERRSNGIIPKVREQTQEQYDARMIKYKATCAKRRLNKMELNNERI